MHLPNMAPNFETIYSALVHINANTTIIPNTDVDRTLIHIILTIVQVAYQALSVGNADYPPPFAPLVAPTFPANSTGAQISEARRTFDEEVRTFKIYHSVDAVLKQQLLSPIEDKSVMPASPLEP